MEDIRAYIESGILELYVLGDVTREEKFEVEAMAAKHPSVRAELDEIERSMESYAKVNAVEPAETQRERILNSLLTNLADDRNFESKQREKPGAVVIPLQTSREVVAYKYAFAACFVLLVVSVAALINAYRQIDQSNTLIVSLQSQNQAIAKTASFRENELNVFRDSSFKLVKLSGTKKSPASKLMVAFSPLKKKVMIDMANTNMPVNDKAHQYQLWAMVGGKPVNLGVFDADTTSKEMVEMKSIASANAFAVTLEPRGGSASPTMSEMMVLGKF